MSTKDLNEYFFNYSNILPLSVKNCLSDFFWERYENDSYTHRESLPFAYLYWIRVFLVAFSFIFIITSVL